MADLAVLALGLDASGMKQGADQATRALTGVEKEMDAAQKKITELEKRLQTSGATAATTSKQFQGLGDSVSKGAGALAGLGGPVGQVAGQFQALQGQIAGLTESFGLIGGAAVGAVAGVAALGGALVKLTLDGVKISDEMGDIAEATGLTIEQMQRLQAAFGASGESIGGIERAFAAFENLVQSAREGSNEAAKTLNGLKVNAQDASKNMGEAFIDVIVRLKDLTQTIEGSSAAHEAFSRQTGALKRVSGELGEVMGQTRGELEKFNKIAGVDSIAAGGRLDHELNQLSQSLLVFKQNLAGTFVGRGLEAYFQTLNRDLRETRTSVDLLTLAWKNLSIAGQLYQVGRRFFGTNPMAPAGPDASDPRWAIGGGIDRPPFQSNPLTPGRTRGGGGETEAEKAAKKLADEIKKLEEGLAAGRKKAADRLIEDMENLADAVRATTVEAIRLATELPVIKETFVDIFNRAGIRTLAGGATPPFTSGAIPGVNIPSPLAPSQITSARQARIEDALGGIFEDFVFQITTARTTVGGAFKGLLLGITDTFAAEFALQVQKSLQEAFIRPLASWLESALGEIFGGLSIKGLAKGLGALASLFVGFFADGGTIPSGHWGVAGERGPEIVYAGSQPMHVTPMGGGGGMSVVMNFSISTATGEVTARTQDQIADAAARGIERASRLRGAR